jgi:hypothetical protein
MPLGEGRNGWVGAGRRRGSDQLLMDGLMPYWVYDAAWTVSRFARMESSCDGSLV